MLKYINLNTRGAQRFAADYREPLAIIGNKSDSELQEPLDDVGRDVQIIDELIGTMLNYVRLDHPDLRMNWQSVPVMPCLEKTVDKCRQPDRDIAFAALIAVRP